MHCLSSKTMYRSPVCFCTSVASFKFNCIILGELVQHLCCEVFIALSLVLLMFPADTKSSSWITAFFTRLWFNKAFGWGDASPFLWASKLVETVPSHQQGWPSEVAGALHWSSRPVGWQRVYVCLAGSYNNISSVFVIMTTSWPESWTEYLWAVLK